MEKVAPTPDPEEWLRRRAENQHEAVLVVCEALARFHASDWPKASARALVYAATEAGADVTLFAVHFWNWLRVVEERKRT